MTDQLTPDPRRARVRLGIGAVVVILILGVGVAILVSALAPSGTTSLVAPGDGSSAAAVARRAATATASGAADAAEASSGATASASDSGDASSSSATLIYVDVIGQVAQPGLYRLAPTDRIVDAIASAGGFTPTADRAALNLAQPLADGQQVVVPAVGESVPPTSSAVAGVPSPTAKVNLNTADATTLETLPRIGPAMAQRILAWRTAHHRFASVSDLQKVSGIGPATFDVLKPLVTV